MANDEIIDDQEELHAAEDELRRYIGDEGDHRCW
jgi:hypothetical protein